MTRASFRHEPPAKGDKADAILDAALDLFAERGFDGTAVPLVAARAKVGAGTIYRYFPSKEHLVNKLFQRWKQRLGRALLDGFPFDAPHREQFHHFWMRAADFARKHPSALRFLELHHHAPYLDEESHAVEKAVLEPARMFFEETARRQITKPFDPMLLGSIVWGALMGLFKAHWEGRLVVTDEVLAQAEDCCWEAIRR
jgi:AcrR family transcriptional regulator